MKKPIQQTIKDVANAMKAGVAEGMLRWSLISDGWQATQVDSIISWAKVYVEKTKGQPGSYPDTTVITAKSNIKI